ncbi:MAG: hypothetical protein RIS92_2244 [Verrucomicrobiota bacterium]|jgi:hypothetical protein
MWVGRVRDGLGRVPACNRSARCGLGVGFLWRFLKRGVECGWHGLQSAGVECDFACGVRSREFGERPRQESNLDLQFRKPSFYPLNYGDKRA